MFPFPQGGRPCSEPRDGSCNENTYFCEKDPEDFNDISRLIGAHEQGFLGGFEEMILFEEDEETKGLSYKDVSRRHKPELRRRLISAKERHLEFRATIPFDVVNLDICGTFFPPRSRVLSPMLRSMRKLLDWQTNFSEQNPTFDSFTVFLTTHVEEGRINEDALRELIAIVETNRTEHSDFSEALARRFGTDDPHAIVEDDFSSFYCIALPKVIVKEAFDRGWKAKASFSGQYQRVREGPPGVSPTTYSMLAWVVQFDRFQLEQLKLGAQVMDYPQMITELTHETLDIDHKTSNVYEDTRSDLAQVVSYREDYLTRIRSGGDSG